MSSESRWLCAAGPLFWLAALAAAGCETAGTHPSPLLGDVQMSLHWGGQVELLRIDYHVTGKSFDKSGSADVAASQTATLSIGGIPAGTGYQVELSAADAKDATITCKGGAGFDVTAGKITQVKVTLDCRLPRTTGSVLVNGQLNLCPVIDELTLLPAETSVGGTVKLTGGAHDVDKLPSPLRYFWSADVGTIDQPKSASALYTCTKPGTFTVKLTVDDGDCQDSIASPVICSGPNGPPPPDPVCKTKLIEAYSASPLQSSTVESIAMFVKLRPEAGNAPISWSATAGSFSDPAAAKTQYACSQPGLQTVTLTVGKQPCVESATFTVACAQISCGDTSLQPGQLCKNPLPIVYPFAAEMSHLITTRDPQPDPSPVRTRPDGLVATGVRAVPATITIGGVPTPIQLQATPQVSPMLAKYLVQQLKTIPFDPKLHKDMLPFLQVKPELQSNQPEVIVPMTFDKQGFPIVFVPPDGWEWVRPWVLHWIPGKGEPSESTASDDVGRVSLALTGSWDTVHGVLNCMAPGQPSVPLAFVGVTVGGVETQTDVTGAFTVTGSFTEVDNLVVRYQGNVITPVGSTTVSSPMMVMNDFHNPRSGQLDTPTGTTTGHTLDVGTITTDSLDCELYELGTQALRDFHTTTGRSPPVGGLRIKRWEGVLEATPYTNYDYIIVALDFRRFAPDRETRRATIFHEFGHSIRHVADGDSGHWGWDLFRWAYGRFHSGREVFNEQYAFNEGWANYWECTRTSPLADCPKLRTGMPGLSFLDWNELRIGQRMGVMATMPGFNHLIMANILRDHPGTIHTFRDFEVQYCLLATMPSLICSGGVPIRAKASCPPGFNDDGATCRQINILAKDSYGRGVGTLPNNCGPVDYDQGLCYAPCPAGFSGFGPLCWENCPPGFQDDGAFCRLDAWIFPSDNSACDFWDRCGITFDAGCSICPPGFHNDGCFCRRDANIFAKQTRGRGIGIIPTSCSDGKVYDNGLCYDPCSPGFTGNGPVCWGHCPPGFDDHGATCYRDPNILVKF